MPDRIQLRRAKGWRMPPGAIYVGRPTIWGNPFAAHDWRAAFRAVTLGCRGDRDGRNEAAVRLYRMWLSLDGTEWIRLSQDNRTWFEREILTVRAPTPPALDDLRRALRGHDLACWCPLDAPCHADTLLEVANA
jgi:hypothetical protein